MTLLPKQRDAREWQKRRTGEKAPEPGVAPHSGATAVPAPPKMIAAQKAQRRWPQKMADALEFLRRRLRAARPRCTAKIDRLVIGCAVLYMSALLELEGHHREKGHWLKPKTPAAFIAYGRVSKLVNKRSGAQILVYSERNSRKLPEYQIIFIPDDKLGLQPEDVLAVVGCVEGHRVSTVEVAFDFPSGSGVHCAFVRQRALFGKCREYSVGKRPGWDAWGSRRGPKFARSYFKEEIDGHRVELQVQARLLRQNRINEIRDLPRLAKILPRDHILFARLSAEKLMEALRNSGLGPTEVQEILNGVASSKGNLWATLRYLRRRAGLKNARRLLVPLAINRDIREALSDWASQWRTAIERSERQQ